MLPAHANPILLEAFSIHRELVETRRALFADCARMCSHETQSQLSAHIRLDDIGEEGSEVDAETAENLAELFPAPFRSGVQSFFSLKRDLAHLLTKPAHQALVSDALTDRARTLRIALAVTRSEQRAAARLQQAAAIFAQAAASGRDITAAEELRLRQLKTSPSDAPEWRGEIRSPETRDGVLVAVSRIRLREARAQLHRGLLLTKQMQHIIDESLSALHRGDPVLFIGETGGAKTALAEYLSRTKLGHDPEFVSGYGDITSAQVIGSHELRAEGGATVTEFVFGPLLRAMTTGRPLILDELNAMPAEFLKRLNRILQLRPGDQFSVQENVGRSVTIAQGFAVIATANEQTPHRYRGLDRLSSELVNRFGANTYRVKYPDAGASYTDTPHENMLLAMASVVDREGALPRSISLTDVERISRVAFVSQQVFAGVHGEGFAEYVSTTQSIDGRPGLEEAVLAPRTLVAILQKVAGSAGAVSIDQAVQRFVEGVMHRDDRRVLSLIAQGQGFNLR